VMIDERGNVKIMDFGIARSMEAGTRLTGSMVGTPAYMAPEQVAGKPVDYRTDIYSLGLMLYEIFTGSQAFKADAPVAVALKQLRDAPPPPHEVEPSIPVGLERTILKCLEKDPARRFQSIDDLENILRPVGMPRIPGASATSMLAPPPLSLGMPHHVLAEKSRRKHTPALVWVLFGAVLVYAGFTWQHWFPSAWATVKQLTTVAPPSTPFSAPKPPDFALEAPTTEPSATEPENTDQQQSSAPPKPGPQAESQPHASSAVPPSITASAPAPTPAPAETSTAPAETPAPVDSKPDASAPPPRDVKPSIKPPQTLEPAPQDVQQRAEKAFGESGNSNKAGEQTYLWVGRFPREEGAQSAAKKIEGLGLTVTIVPRQGPLGKFYVVYTGPFGEKRVPDVMQWLEAQGFLNVHPVKTTAPPPKQPIEP